MPFFANADINVLLTDALKICRDVANPVLPESAWRRYGFHRSQCGNTDAPAFARYGIPYVLDSLGGGRGILLNRDYKPVGVGIAYSMYVDYEEFPQWILTGDALARVLAEDFWIRRHEGLYMLFHDGCAPWESRAELRRYTDRLGRLVEALQPNERTKPCEVRHPAAAPTA